MPATRRAARARCSSAWSPIHGAAFRRHTRMEINQPQKGGKGLFNKAICGALCCGTAILCALAPSAGASTQGGCVLQGQAAFSKGLNTSSHAFNYGFTGTLTDCQASDSAAPTNGTVEAGQTVTKQVTNSITHLTDTVTYAEPSPSGTGSCASSTTGGFAVTRWSDGSVTVLSYSTTGAAAAVELSGSVIPSLTLNAVNAAQGDPTSITINTTRYATSSGTGQGAGGVLAFQPPDPTACNTSTGVTVAGISGAIGLNG